jgi:hypothetical protein
MMLLRGTKLDKFNEYDLMMEDIPVEFDGNTSPAPKILDRGVDFQFTVVITGPTYFDNVTVVIEEETLERVKWRLDMNDVLNRVEGINTL